MSDKPKNLSEIDNFWDLNSLLPKKRPVAPTHRAVNTDTVELELERSSAPSDSGAAIPPRAESAAQGASHAPASQGASTAPDMRIPSPRNEARRLNELSMRTRAEANRSQPLEPYLVYEPQSRLIRRVSVSKWQTRYNFYEKFRDDARRLWDRAASECEPVSFFSYIPQYNQLKYAQLKWYLKWRDNVRRGIYLRTDFSYILLYIFEIINCPDLVAPEKGIGLLCDIWINYRKEHRRIDSYLCDWVCDYCLINKLPCPTERLEPILGDIVAAAEFKEFYMDAGNNLSSAASILTYSSTYDWRSSRYVTKENTPLFATHIRAAFDKAYREVLAEKFDEIEAKEIHIDRDAYNGALCVYDMKRSLGIDCISYARSPKFRFVVTDIIKYSENRIRMALGIKARLKVEELSDTLRACIDEYFDEKLPIPGKSHTKAKKEESRDPEYDKLYEPVSTAFSLDNALAIEKKSWDTTEILTAALNDGLPPIADGPEPAPAPIAEPTPAPPPKPEPVPAFTPAPEPTLSDGGEFADLVAALDETARTALRSLADGDSAGIARAAASAGMLADALADKINECAFDIIGDSIVESDGTGYKIISDYEGDLIPWLK